MSPRTALVLLLEEAAPEVAAAYRELDPLTADRLPFHITVLFPFAAREAVGEPLLDRLRALLAPRPPLELSIARVEVFTGVAVYAAPEPDDELIALVHDVAAAFPDYPPYDGVHEDVVPHATLAKLTGRDDDARVAEVRERVEPLLPTACSAGAVSLLEEFQPERWRELHRFPLAAQVPA